MPERRKTDPRWPAVILWGILSAIALPIWVVGAASAVLRVPLRYAAGRLNAELHRPVPPPAAEAQQAKEPPGNP